jgi:predicted Zn-dependent peptidase
MSTLLGGGMSSRLFQEIREKRGLVYSIYSFASPFKDGGLFGIYAGTGESEAAELMPVVLAELGKVQDHVNEPEIARARAQVKANLLMSQESTGSRCEQLARQIQTFDRVISTEEVLGKINAVTEADIRRVAGRHFRAAPTLTTVGPSEQVPGLANIVEMLAA